MGKVLPAMGYGPAQIRDLEQTIANADCDLVLFATPIHLPRILNIEKPNLRVRYEYHDHGSPTLEEVLMEKLQEPPQ
jgi:predicted GTPase